MTFYQLTPHASKWPREIEMGFKIKTKWALLDLFIRVQALNKSLSFRGGGGEEGEEERKWECSWWWSDLPFYANYLKV